MPHLFYAHLMPFVQRHRVLASFSEEGIEHLHCHIKRHVTQIKRKCILTRLKFAVIKQA